MSKERTAKRTLKRLLSLTMVIVMILSIAVIPASAATSVTKSVTSKSGQLSQMASAKVTTGKGLTYSLGWKYTTVTVRNTGKYPVQLYERNSAGLVFWKGELVNGATRTFRMNGSAKTSTLYFARERGNTSISVSVSAGSVS